MEIYTTEVAATRVGAACLGVRSPRANLAAVGAKHALAPNAVLTAGSTGARLVARRLVPAQTPQFAPMSAELLPTVNETLKTVHKTRINAGGYGAMGPHPEPEQPA